jgi:hypothetical protein
MVFCVRVAGSLFRFFFLVHEEPGEGGLSSAHFLVQMFSFSAL